MRPFWQRQIAALSLTLQVNKILTDKFSKLMRKEKGSIESQY